MIQTKIDLSKIKVKNSKNNPNGGMHYKEVLGLIKAWCDRKKITFNYNFKNGIADFSFLENKELNQFNKKWKK